MAGEAFPWVHLDKESGDTAFQREAAVELTQLGLRTLRDPKSGGHVSPQGGLVPSVPALPVGPRDLLLTLHGRPVDSGATELRALCLRAADLLGGEPRGRRSCSSRCLSPGGRRCCSQRGDLSVEGGVPRLPAQLGRMGSLTLPHTLVPECPCALLEPGGTSVWVSRDRCVHNCLGVASSLPAADR